MGGKTIVLGGDFRQILPVIRKGSRQDIVGAAVNSSKIWNGCKVLRLTKNMRLSFTATGSNQEDIRQFADWILQIGNGEINANEYGKSLIDVPDDILIKDVEILYFPWLNLPILGYCRT